MYDVRKSLRVSRDHETEIFFKGFPGVPLDWLLCKCLYLLDLNCLDEKKVHPSTKQAAQLLNFESSIDLESFISHLLEC